MNQLSLIGQLSSLPEQRAAQPLDQSHHFAQYLKARFIEVRRRYIEALQAGLTYNIKYDKAFAASPTTLFKEILKVIVQNSS
jgi:hypothetical protein